MAEGVGIPAGAAQTVIPHYAWPRDDYFWPLLYDIGGETVYCAQPFDAGAEATEDGFTVTIEHAYPANWIAADNVLRGRMIKAVM